MKLNLERSFTDMGGEPMKDDKGKLQPSMARTLAEVIGATPPQPGARTLNALKLWSLAQKMYANGDLDIDKSDIETLRTFIEDHAALSIAGKGQLLEVIAGALAAKPEAEEKAKG